MFDDLAKIVNEILTENGINPIYFIDVCLCILMFFEIRSYKKQEIKEFRTKSRLFLLCFMALIFLGLSIEQLCKSGK
jgi:hypothetical protein